MTLNSCNYAISNPLNYKEPGGHAIDTVFDIVSLFTSAVAFVKNPSIAKGLSLAWDLFAVAVSGVLSVELMDYLKRYIIEVKIQGECMLNGKYRQSNQAYKKQQDILKIANNNII